MKKTPAKDHHISPEALVEMGKQFYERRWMWGTSGNLSFRLNSAPLTILMTPSSINKGHMTQGDLLTITEGKPSPAHPKGLIPSSDAVIHQAIYHAVPGARAVFHVHAMYSTLISRFHG